MPSRRAVLFGAGGLTAIGGLGWIGLEHASVIGAIRRKYVDVSWESNGRRRHGRILWSWVESGGEIEVSYAPTYAESAVRSPREITVDDRLESRLRGEFSDVTYRLGVCGTAPGDCGFSMKRVSRDGFNRAQLGDTATVVDLETRLYVHTVTERSTWSDPSETETYDFTDAYPTYERGSRAVIRPASAERI